MTTILKTFSCIMRLSSVDGFRSICFISGSFFAMSQFRTIKEPFSSSWWIWLTATGAMLAGAISVKFVGLFIVLYVGIFTISQLWSILGDLNQPFMYTVKHFVARAICLIAVPIALYMSIFYIHLTVLSKSAAKLLAN